jgi:hypothetical protein
MMKELSLDDSTLKESLHSQLDHMKQKDNESMVEYVALMTTLKNLLFAVEKDTTKQAAVQSSLVRRHTVA